MHHPLKCVTCISRRTSQSDEERRRDERTQRAENDLCAVPPIHELLPTLAAVLLRAVQNSVARGGTSTGLSDVPV